MHISLTLHDYQIRVNLTTNYKKPQQQQQQLQTITLACSYFRRVRPEKYQDGISFGDNKL